MPLTAHSRRSLRSLQRWLESSLPSAMLENIDRNDAKAWGSLAELEFRMLVARGQTQQARQIVDRLFTATESGLPIEAFDRSEIHLLINAIDSFQAARHFLARNQLSLVAKSSQPTIRWAAELWRSRSLMFDEGAAAARGAIERALPLADKMPPDAKDYTACFLAEVEAADGAAEAAEMRVLRALSSFVGARETRGVSLAYLSLAAVTRCGGAQEESDAAVDLAYETDGSWGGPVIWLARRALAAGDVGAAAQSLRSVPNPSSDVYGLLQALNLVELREIPASAVLRNLELGERPATDEVIDELRELLEENPTFIPADLTLAWKLLMCGRFEEATKQLAVVLADEETDGQSVAALRFGLQTYKQQHEQESPEPSAAVKPAEPSVAVKTKEVSTEKEMSPQTVPEPEGAKQGGFAGQLSLFSVPDLVQFFSNSRKSGQVVFSSREGDAKIRLHEGSIYWAVSPSNPSVAQFLRDKEIISAEQFTTIGGQDDAVSAVVDDDSVGNVRQGLQELIHVTMKELVEWIDGWFVFDGSPADADPRGELLFSAQGVLLDALRELDEDNR